MPNIVLIGVPNVNALNRVKLKLETHRIPHYCWIEPDYDLGFTAICTSPLREDKRQHLRNYRLYNHPVVQGQNILPLKQEMEDTALPGMATEGVSSDTDKSLQ